MTPEEVLARLRSLDVQLRSENGRLKVSAPKGSLTPELQALLAAEKDGLLRLVDAGDSDSANVAAGGDLGLRHVDRTGNRAPLSFFQERLWMVQRLEPGHTAYNLSSLLTPENPVDVAILSESVRRTVARHEILRSTFVLIGAEPTALIGGVDSVSIGFEDLRSVTDDERHSVLAWAAERAAHQPFDLGAEPPVRFVIFQTADDRAALLVSAHHIALDSWSFGLLVNELQSQYASAVRGEPAAPAPELQYADFAIWQRRMMERGGAADRLAYWKGRLSGLPQLSTFPSDRQPGLVDSGVGKTVQFEWPAELLSGIKTVARESNATVYMVLLAAIAAVLHRHTGQPDLAIGSPVGTRSPAELEQVIGPILNPLVMRFDLSDDPTFAELIARARDAVLDGYANQEVPFERVVQGVNPERAVGRSPLFQVAAVLHNAPDASLVPITGGGAIYDVTVFAHERRGTLGGSFEYRTDLYDEATIVRIAGHVERLLSAAVRDPKTRVSALPLLGDEEKRLVTTGFNATDAEIDRASVTVQLSRVAAERPDDIAVVANGDSLTYRALDRRSTALAARLRALGVQPGGYVGLAADRSCALLTAIMGILKAGAAYVPIDLDYPAERIALMLRDGQSAHIVTVRALAPALAKLGPHGTEVFVDDADIVAASDNAEFDRPLDDGPRPEDPAYLIFTSGSTGTPKGVVVPHLAVSNLLAGFRAMVGFTPSDVIVATASASFDISVLELFLPLVQGGRVVIGTRDVATDGAKIARLLETSGATTLQLTPSSWRLLMHANWAGNPSLRAISGGEPMPRDLADWLLSHVGQIWNCYGPTETTVYSSGILLETGDQITIGPPLVNQRFYIVDSRLALVPIGAPGEICIAGDGLATGYKNRPEQTAERFVPEIGRAGLMYRSGDIGRWHADGTVEALGRADGQIKLRGYRIEVGEIEAALAAHGAVSAAIADVRGTPPSDLRLVAWVRFHDHADATPSELRRFLRERLPEYMIPAMIVPVDAMPITQNGKIDRRRLPDPFGATAAALTAGSPPSTPTELVIAEIWSRLLKVPRIATQDSFFELGGHSLLAMRAAAEITALTGRPIDPRLLFFRTLGQLAEALDALGAQDESVAQRRA